MSRASPGAARTELAPARGAWPRLRAARRAPPGAVPKGRSGRRRRGAKASLGIGSDIPRRYAGAWIVWLILCVLVAVPVGASCCRPSCPGCSARAARGSPCRLSARRSRLRVQGAVQLHLGQLRSLCPRPRHRRRAGLDGAAHQCRRPARVARVHVGATARPHVFDGPRLAVPARAARGLRPDGHRRLVPPTTSSSAPPGSCSS